MTLPEFASMVEIMRRDQKLRDQHMTHAASITASHSERAVDKAVKQIMDDSTTDDVDVMHVK